MCLHQFVGISTIVWVNLFYLCNLSNVGSNLNWRVKTNDGAWDGAICVRWHVWCNSSARFSGSPVSGTFTKSLKSIIQFQCCWFRCTVSKQLLPFCTCNAYFGVSLNYLRLHQRDRCNREDESVRYRNSVSERDREKEKSEQAKAKYSNRYQRNGAIIKCTRLLFPLKPPYFVRRLCVCVQKVIIWKITVQPVFHLRTINLWLLLIFLANKTKFHENVVSRSEHKDSYTISTLHSFYIIFVHYHFSLHFIANNFISSMS